MFFNGVKLIIMYHLRNVKATDYLAPDNYTTLEHYIYNDQTKRTERGDFLTIIHGSSLIYVDKTFLEKKSDNICHSKRYLSEYTYSDKSRSA